MHLYQGDLLYHASLSPDEYTSLLDSIGFEVIAHAVEDWQTRDTDRLFRVVIPSMLAMEVGMTPIEKLVRPARIEDADVLAELVDYAGEGPTITAQRAGPEVVTTPPAAH